MDFFKLARTQGVLLCPGANAPQKLLLIVLYLNRTNLGVTFLTHLCALRRLLYAKRGGVFGGLN